MTELTSTDSPLHAQLVDGHIPHMSNRAAPLADVPASGETIVEIPFITGHRLIIHRDHGVDFTTTFGDQLGSNRMWMFSLHVVRVLCETHRRGQTWAAPFIVSVLESYFRFLDEDDHRVMVDATPSGDHSTAVRVRAYLEVLELQDELPGIRSALEERIIAELAYSVEWLGDDSHYRANNHGLMGSISLLYASIRMGASPEAERLRNTACQRILELAGTSFDEDGLCDENTVGYHNFNLHCYDEVVFLQEQYHLDDRLEKELIPTLQRAMTALQLCIHQDSTVPTVGDSAGYRVRHSSVNRSSVYRQSGFAVVKDDKLYLSLICGARSEVHKHVDDSSITLRWGNIPLITDAGSYLYDRTNPFRLAMESSRGHSGVFPASIEGKSRASALAGSGGLAAQIDAFEEFPGATLVGCSYTAGNGSFGVRRRLLTLEDGVIGVLDTAYLSDDVLRQERRVVSRWNMGPGYVLRRAGAGSWLAESKYGPALSVHQCQNVSAELYSGETTAPYRGWHSSVYAQKTPVPGLDFTSTGRVHRFATIISVNRPVLGMDQAPKQIADFLLGDWTHP